MDVSQLFQYISYEVMALKTNVYILDLLEWMLSHFRNNVSIVVLPGQHVLCKLSEIVKNPPWKIRHWNRRFLNSDFPSALNFSLDRNLLGVPEGFKNWKVLMTEAARRWGVRKAHTRRCLLWMCTETLSLIRSSHHSPDVNLLLFVSPWLCCSCVK